MKKQYISPTAELLELPKLHSMLAHFSADAGIIDIVEMDPEEEIESEPDPW